MDTNSPNSHRPSTDDRRTVHVVGGGLAGLATAALIARAGTPVVVHEQRERLGGRATTDSRNGFRFNRGPHALYLGGAGVEVLERLGVALPGSRPSTDASRMVRGGVAHLLPGSAWDLARTRLLGVRDKAELGRFTARLASVDPDALADVTVTRWIDDQTTRPRVRTVVHALVRLAAYTHAPDELSAQVGVMQLQQALGAGVRYLDHGWERLVEQLASIVTGSGGTIRRHAAVDELPDAAAVVIAAGGPDVARRLTGHAFVVGPPSEAAVVDLALAAPPSARFVVGVDEPYYLSDHGFVRGMTPDDRWSVSLAQYLAPAGQAGHDPDRAGLRAFARHAGITDDAVVDERYLHRMTTISAIPTAALGGLAGRPSVVVDDLPGVFLAGDWVGSRGHLADAVLASAADAAHAAVAHVARSVAA